MQRIIDGTLLCSECEKRLPLTAFSRNAASKTGLEYVCRGCRQIKRKAWFAARTPEEMARYRETQREATRQRWIAKLAEDQTIYHKGKHT